MVIMMVVVVVVVEVVVAVVMVQQRVVVEGWEQWQSATASQTSAPRRGGRRSLGAPVG